MHFEPAVSGISSIVSNVGVVVVLLIPLYKFCHTVLDLCVELITNIVYKCINIGAGMLYVASCMGSSVRLASMPRVLSSTSIKRNSGVGLLLPMLYTR